MRYCLFFCFINLCFGNFSIDPSKIIVDDSENIQTINITNNSPTILHYQVSVVSLLIKDGKEVEDVSNDFAIFPKILKLKQNETRKIQLKYQKDNDPTDEKNFRLVLRQINTFTEQKTVTILFDFKIPIFVSPKYHGEPQKPVCKLKNSELKCFNPNPEHIILAKLVFRDYAIKRDIPILPKSEKSITLPDTSSIPEIKKGERMALEFFYVNESVIVESVELYG